MGNEMKAARNVRVAKEEEDLRVIIGHRLGRAGHKTLVTRNGENQREIISQPTSDQSFRYYQKSPGIVQYNLTY